MTASGLRFLVIASASCRVCGDVYGLVLPVGGATAAVLEIDTGLCANCHAADDVKRAGVLSLQVVADFDSMTWAMGWDEQAQAAADEKRRQLKDRYPPPTTETRTCPVCCEDFKVCVHERKGRTRAYCSTQCAATARKRRERARVTL